MVAGGDVQGLVEIHAAWRVDGNQFQVGPVKVRKPHRLRRGLRAGDRLG